MIRSAVSRIVSSSSRSSVRSFSSSSSSHTRAVVPPPNSPKPTFNFWPFVDRTPRPSLFGTRYQKDIFTIVVLIGLIINFVVPGENDASKYARYKLYHIDKYELPNLTPPPDEEPLDKPQA